jgi:hypothetical protein
MRTRLLSNGQFLIAPAFRIGTFLGFPVLVLTKPVAADWVEDAM